MNKYLRLIWAITAWGWLACVPSRGQSPGQAEPELIRLQGQWATARIQGDVAFLEKLYAKEFRVSAIDGSIVSRAADIGVFATREMKPEIIEDTDLHVSRYGEVALVTGLEHVKGTYKGNPGDFMIRFTNVFVRRDGRWQLITHHGTEVRKKTN